MKSLQNNFRILFLSLLALSFSGCDDDDEAANLPTIMAGFTQTLVQGTGTVSFINTSENADSFVWDFGDGTTSTEINPIHAYGESGTFTASLTASNSAGASSTFEDELVIAITTGEPPMSDFDSGLLVNGDFEAGVDPWIGNAANVVTDGGNSFNQADVETAGNPFDVNLSQVVELVQGTNYILTFDASASEARTMLAGIGLNVDPFTNTAPEVNLTTDTQTFTLQLAANDFGGADSRVLFDMGAAVGTVIIDNVSLVEGGDGSDTNGGTSDSNLLVNGDFEAGSEPWFTNFGDNVPEIREEGGNNFFFANVETAGDAFLVNLSQVVEIVQGTNYILTFDASSDQARTILAGIGLNEDPFTSTAPEVNLTTDTQTFTLQLAANDFGGANSRVLFDMGAAVGTVVIDNVSLVEGGDGSDTNGGGGAFDSGLLVNGDFEAGADPWIGTGLNVVSEGGNSFNLADVQTAGNAFDVNLSQVVAITQGTNYILTFDASSDQSRTMLAGIGLNVDPFTNTAPEVNLTTDTQTFTLQLAANDFGGADSRVLFDMGAAVGVVVIDNVSLVEGGDGSDTNGGGGAFDSGLLVNGDFEAGSEPWFTNFGDNVPEIREEGGNNFFFANVETAGDAFLVNLSQVVEIVQGTNYILTFDASSDQARTMLAGIGLNVDPFTNTAPEVNLTTDTQTFTLQLAATEFGGADSRVLFDMGAAVGTVVIDNVSLVVGGDGSDTN